MLLSSPLKAVSKRLAEFLSGFKAPLCIFSSLSTLYSCTLTDRLLIKPPKFCQEASRRTIVPSGKCS
ncbi:hypothetical protein KCV07_g520, partial [Aureobasidium melanogenum]